VHQDVEGDGFLPLGRPEIAGQQRSQFVADTLDGVQRAEQRREGFGAGQRFGSFAGTLQDAGAHEEHRVHKL